MSEGTGTKEIRVAAGIVYAVGEGPNKSLLHVVRIRNGLICLADSPHGDERWESETAFAKRNPIAVGRLKKGLWRDKYAFD